MGDGDFACFSGFFRLMIEIIVWADLILLSVETFAAQGGIPSPRLSPHGRGEGPERITNCRLHP
jgi:hypothetical protein